MTLPVDLIMSNGMNAESTGSWVAFDQKVDHLFFGRKATLAEFHRQISNPGTLLPLVNIHGVTGTGKSFLLHRFLQMGRARGLPTVKIQFDGKDREESVGIGQHHEILRQIALRLGVPTPRFATAYLAWSLSNEFSQPGQREGMSTETKNFLSTSAADLISFVVTASLGPGGIMVAAAKAGWRFLAERVSAEPLTAFAQSKEGKAFHEELRSHRVDEIPAMLNKFLAEDLRLNLRNTETQPGASSARAIIAFDSWEQFEERYPERRSRWYEERQILELFRCCNSFVQFVIVGQRPVAWTQEDHTVLLGREVHDLPIHGLSRFEAEGYLRECRGVASPEWREAMLEATIESGNGKETYHHALSLGMIADTSLEILATDPLAEATQLEVKPNDLEDLVRRFLSVREEMEPVFERLSLTPRFDEQAVALALGKTYDEFGAISDFEAMLRLSFIDRLSEQYLSIHGLMRRMLRERMERQSPQKIRAGHASWRRHYAERGHEDLAFRHHLGVNPSEALDWWRGQLLLAWQSNQADRYTELTALGKELDDELPYIAEVVAADFCLEWAKALRLCPLGDKLGQLALGLSLTDRALRYLQEVGEQDMYAKIRLERGLVQIDWAEVAGDSDRYSLALDEYSAALVAASPGTALWVRVQLARATALRLWARKTGSREQLREGLESCQIAEKAISRQDQPMLWADIQTELAALLRTIGHLEGEPDYLIRSTVITENALQVFTLEEHPVSWAEGKDAVGSVMRDLADFSGGVEELARSMEAFREAETVWSREVSPFRWGRLQIAMAYTLVEWGHRDSDTTHFAEAIQRCQGCLEVYPREVSVFTWSLAHGNIAKALRFWGDIDRDPKKLAQAAESFRLAVSGRSPTAAAFYWSLAHVNLALTLLSWNEVEPNVNHLREAISGFEAALSIESPDFSPSYFESARESLEVARRLLAESAERKAVE